MIITIIIGVAIAALWLLPEEDWRLFTEENWKEFRDREKSPEH